MNWWSWEAARDRARALALSGLVATLLVSVAVACAEKAGNIVVVNDNPAIVVQRHAIDDLYVPDMTWGGVVGHDPDSGCLYLRMAGAAGPHTALVWPVGSRPRLVDGVRGVEVPGHGLVWEGDTIVVMAGAFDPPFWKEFLAQEGETEDLSQFEGFATAMARCGEPELALVIAEIRESRSAVRG